MKECACSYELCEFYYFRNPHLRPGFEEADGRVLASAETRYPEAWTFLQTPEGQALCLTEAEWQAMSTATFATLADGTTVGWNGVGGVPYFVLDPASGTLRLPDLRGMYAEAAGFDSLGVGDVHGDGIRQLTGTLQGGAMYNDSAAGATCVRGTGCFEVANRVTESFYALAQNGTYDGSNLLRYDTGRVAPTANKNQPRAWGALACVYLGNAAD